MNVSHVRDQLNVGDTAARRGIDQAVRAGILIQSNDRQRNQVWLAREVIQTLDQFAERAGRRAG